MRPGILRGLAAGLISLGLMLAAYAETGLGQSQAGADLTVTIKGPHKRLQPHQRVDFSITVTNLGPGTAAGPVIAFKTAHGLSHPELVAAPPPSLEVSCTPTPPGDAPSCTVTPAPPPCQTSGRVLTCRYSTLQLPPGSGQNSSLTVVVSAVTGTKRKEAALAGVTGASYDPDVANDQATARVRVVRF